LVPTAEVGAGVGADQQVAVAGADDVHALSIKEDDRVVVVDSALEERHPLVEAVGTLIEDWMSLTSRRESFSSKSL
jgi:hypothetical protein